MRYFKPRSLLLAASATLLFAVSFALLNGQQSASAATFQQISNDVTYNAPAPRYVGDAAADACINKGWNVFQMTWISPLFDSDALEITVNEGDSSAWLQLNWISYRCTTSSSIVYGHTDITTTSPSISDLNGATYKVDYVPTNTTGFKTGVAKAFQYPGPFGGFDDGDIISVVMTTKGTRTFADGTDLCAIHESGDYSGNTGGGPTEFSKCTAGDGRFTIVVRIRDNPQTVYNTADCNTVNYRVSDPDNDNYDAYLMWDSESAVLIGSNIKPSSTPGDVKTYSIANRKDLSSHKLKILSISRGRQKHWVLGPEITVGPCVTPTCKQVSIVGTPTVGQDFELRASFNGSIGAAAPGIGYFGWIESGFAGVTISPGSAPQYAQGGTIPSGGDPSEIVWTLRKPTAGVITGAIHFRTGSNPNQDISCPINGGIPVTQNPYVRVWRGDVAAGCVETGTGPWFPTSTSDPGKVLTWNVGDGKGSGVDFAAQALGRIDQFSTQQNANMGTQDKRMTLANIGAGVGGWGGSFGKSQCAADHEFPAASGGSISSVSLDSAESTVTYSGGTINPSTISNGKHLTVYVDGDVLIVGAGVSYNTTGWAKPSDIPSLTLIVRGDIKIASSVSSLSGTYIAMPSSNGATGGTIYTCSNGNSTSSELLGACQNQLTVYGSFVARTIKFLRLSGSVGTANPADNYGSGTAAERFVYSPEIWLSSPSSTANSGYDSITSLPPVF